MYSDIIKEAYMNSVRQPQHRVTCMPLSHIDFDILVNDLQTIFSHDTDLFDKTENVLKDNVKQFVYRTTGITIIA